MRTAVVATVMAAGVLLGATGCTEDVTGAGGTGGGAQKGGGGPALAGAESLTVKGRAPKTGYDRDKFGSPWADTDSNDCDTRVISMVRAVMELFSQRMGGVVGYA